MLKYISYIEKSYRSNFSYAFLFSFIFKLRFYLTELSHL